MDDSLENTPTRQLRARKERKLYSDEWALPDDETEAGTVYNIPDKLESDRFDQTFIKEMNGADFTLAYLQRNGFGTPILFKDKAGLGLQVPNPTFTISDVRTCVGSNRTIEVMDVATQKNIEMSMKDFQKYYDDPQRDRLLNVISLEFSQTRLEHYIRRPTIVRQIDWVDCVWPRHLVEAQRESTNSLKEMVYPKVQKYCLMSVKGCYTDFHIDFGGTSVWYHILKGSKVFWLVPPLEQNIRQYEQWVLSGKQSDIFFGDMVEKCSRIFLGAGDTFFIPTGWIHAVYTLKDSLVFGGNFLHSFGIEKQLRIAHAEDITHVPQKYRYPLFTELLWYVLERYVYSLLGTSHLKPEAAQKENRNTNVVKNEQRVHLTSQELHGLKAIIKYVHTLAPSKKNVPDLIIDPVLLIKDVRKLIEIHCLDSPDSAITGRPILVPLARKTRIRIDGGENGDMKAKMLKKLAPRPSGSDKNVARRRRTRCKRCQACLTDDCGQCVYCQDMVKFGGPGRAKQTCIARQCLQPMLPLTAACAICGLDGWGQQVIIPLTKAACKDIPSSLMECSICYEITHMECLSNRIPSVEGIVNEDLPNSWECLKCCRSGKNLESKPRHFRARLKCSDARRSSAASDTSSVKREFDSEYSDSFEMTSEASSRIDLKPRIKSEVMSSPESKFVDDDNEDIMRPSGLDTKLCNLKSPDMIIKYQINKTSGKHEVKRSEMKKSTADYKNCKAALKSLNLSKKRKLQNGNGKLPSIEFDDDSISGSSNSRWLEECVRKSQEEDQLLGNTAAFGSLMSTTEPKKVALRTQLAHHLNSNSNKPLKRPTFAVRPAPVPSKTQTAENSAMPHYMSRRSLYLIFRHLNAGDLRKCCLVCKAWCSVSVEPSLWKKIDLTNKQLSPICLSSVVRRQPETLNLDWTSVNKRQLEWLITRLPQLRELSLQGCTWGGASALRMCGCPPLTFLDLSFVSGMNDGAVRDILSPPKDTRPGLVDTKSRLRNLKTLKLAGCDITDVSLRYIVQNIAGLNTLDISQCGRITDAGIAQLTTAPATTMLTLTHLDLSGLSSITDIGVEHVAKCIALKYLDLRHTVLVTAEAVQKLLHSRPDMSMVENKLLIIQSDDSK